MTDLELPGVAILASGGGTTAEAFIHATHDRTVLAEVGLVVCSKPIGKAAIWERVSYLNAQYQTLTGVEYVSAKTHPDGAAEFGQTDSESSAIVELVKSYDCSLIVLMGYMRLVRGELLDSYGWHPEYTSPYQAAMLNTHPGPLPETAGQYGIHASETVKALNLSQSKHTVHVVSADYDQGPIIAENSVPVMENDSPETIFQRVQSMEKERLPTNVHQFLVQQALYRANLVS